MLHLLNTLIVFICLLHVWFMVLECWLWQRPIGIKIFRLNPTFARESATLALNQGVYNGFLAAGLLWGLFAQDDNVAYQVTFFFLSCVTIAGIVGGLSVKKKIFFIQGLPAIVALLMLLCV